MLPKDFDKTSIWKKGDPEKIFFLPFLGEFGCYLTTYVHDVYRVECKEKIVSIRPGHRILFPNCTDHFYDWDIHVLDKHRDGTNRTTGPKNQIKKLMDTIIREYPQYKDFTFISPFGKYAPVDYNFKLFTPEDQRHIVWHKPDVTFGARYRLHHPGKNLSWDLWNTVIKGIKDKGWTTGLIGEEHTTVDDLPVDYKSWDYHYGLFDVRCSIGLIQHSKLLVTSNCGVMHLGNLCDKDMIILRNKVGMIANMERLQKNNRFIFIDDWKNTDLIIDVIQQYLINPTKKITIEGVEDTFDR